LDKRLGGPQRRPGHCGDEKILALAETRTPAVQFVSVPTELSLLFIYEEMNRLFIITVFRSGNNIFVVEDTNYMLP
jgi:hypothetical protein